MRNILVRIAFIAFGCCAAALAPAQEPEIPKLMRIVVPFSPGGSNDQIARAIAPALAKRLGNSVIVENKPGAGGVIGSDAVAKAAPDGATLLLSSSSFLTAAATQPRTPFDPVASFAPVSMIAEGPLLLAVSATSPHRSPQSLLSAARDKPGTISYASSGVGSVAQLATELLAADAKLQLLHVPYKGAANALLDLVGGQVDFMLSNYSSLAPQIKAGKVRPLAVTSQEKSDIFPDLPPLSASAPGYAIEIWVGVLAPAGTPPAVVARLNKEVNAVLAQADVKERLAGLGVEPGAGSAADFRTLIETDAARYGDAIRRLGIKAD